MADTQFADEEEYKEYLRWKRKQEQIAQEQARAAAEPRAPVPEWATPPEMRPAPAPVAQLPPRYANTPYRAPMGVGTPPPSPPPEPTPELPPRPPVDWGAAAQIPAMVNPPPIPAQLTTGQPIGDVRLSGPRPQEEPMPDIQSGMRSSTRPINTVSPAPEWNYLPVQEKEEAPIVPPAPYSQEPLRGVRLSGPLQQDYSRAPEITATQQINPYSADQELLDPLRAITTVAMAPQQTIFGGLKGLREGDVLEGMSKAVSGYTPFREVLEAYGVTPDTTMGKAALDVLGPSGDILLDPWIAGGTVARGARALTPGIVKGAKAVNAAVTSPEAQAIARQLAPGLGIEDVSKAAGTTRTSLPGEVGKVTEGVPPIEPLKPPTATGASSAGEGLPKPPTTTVQNDVVAALRKEVLELSNTERGSFSLKAWKGDDGTLYVERSTGGGGYSYSTVLPDGTIKPGMPEVDLGEPIERMTLNSGKAAEGVPPATGANAAPPAGTPPGGRPPVPPAGAEPPVPPKPPDAVPPPPVDPVPPVPPSGAVDAERAGNILLSKHPEAIRDELKAVYESDPARFEAARRGVRSDAQVRADAIALIDSVGGNGAKSVGKWKPGQAWNAEEILALREVLARRTRAVMEAREAVGASGDSTSNLVRLKVAIDEQRRAQKAIAGITAESGRALRQFRKDVSGALVSGREEQLRVILERLGGRDMTESLLDKLSKLDLDNPEAVYRFLRNSDTTPSYLMEVFYNSILSSTGTHFRNAIGNTLAAGFVPIETGVAAAIDLPLAKLSGRARERFFGEVPAGTFAAARALKDGLRKALYIVQNGYSLDDVAMLEMRRSEAFTGKVGAVLNQPSRLLVASDAIFRSIHYSAALNMGAYRMASKAGLKGQERVARIAELLTSPPEELMAYAGKMARYRVYQQPPGTLARGLMNVASPTLGVGKFTIQPVKFVLPFIPTPINLAKYGLERSPLGIVTIPSKIWRKDPEAADAIARWLIGTTISGAVVAYAADGKITGAAPENPVERDLFYRQGKQPYSVLIGDRWVPYNMMEPLNQPLVMASSVVKALRTGNDPGSTLTSMAGSVAKGITQQRYLTGVADLINVIEDPERYADKPFERTVVSFGVPFSSLSRGIAQTIDPTIRKAEGLGETLKSAIPGQSQSLEPRQNVWGEDIVRESSPLFPSAISTVKNDPLDQELARLGVTVGFLGDQVKRIPLTAQEQTEYQRAAGEATKKYLQGLMEHPTYQAATEMDKAKLLERASKRIKDAEADRFYVKIGGPQIEAMIRKVESNPAYRNATPQVREALLKRTIERTRAAMGR